MEAQPQPPFVTESAALAGAARQGVHRYSPRCRGRTGLFTEAAGPWCLLSAGRGPSVDPRPLRFLRERPSTPAPGCATGCPIRHRAGSNSILRERSALRVAWFARREARTRWARGYGPWPVETPDDLGRPAAEAAEHRAPVPQATPVEESPKRAVPCSAVNLAHAELPRVGVRGLAVEDRARAAIGRALLDDPRTRITPTKSADRNARDIAGSPRIDRGTVARKARRLPGPVFRSDP